MRVQRRQNTALHILLGRPQSRLTIGALAGDYRALEHIDWQDLVVSYSQYSAIPLQAANVVVITRFSVAGA